MQYYSYHDMSNIIRNNINKVPDDILLIVGIPRSGMLAALMIAETLNLPCVDLEKFLSTDNIVAQTGYRKNLMKLNNRKSILIVDDTVNSGLSLGNVKKQIEKYHKTDKWKIYYACIFAEGEHAKEKVDIYFYDNYIPNEKNYLYEWNIFHHYLDHSITMMCDLDGVFCVNPPDDHNTEAYENYIKNAIPLIIPSSKLGAICTYRLEKYRDLTQQWLNKVGIKTDNLVMFPADTKEKRNKIPPYIYKAKIYKSCVWAEIFIESNPFEAENIFKLTGKPVLCFETGKFYK